MQRPPRGKRSEPGPRSHLVSPGMSVDAKTTRRPPLQRPGARARAAERPAVRCRPGVFVGACLALTCLLAGSVVAQDSRVRLFAVHSHAWDDWPATYDSSVFAFMNQKYDGMLVYASWRNGGRDDNYPRGWLYVDGYSISPGGMNFEQYNLLRYALRDESGSLL